MAVFDIAPAGRADIDCGKRFCALAARIADRHQRRHSHLDCRSKVGRWNTVGLDSRCEGLGGCRECKPAWRCHLGR